MGIAEEIASLEKLLNELVIKYEQYFLGVEKREPLQLLAEVERVARTYAAVNIVNTMVKFKYNSAVAKLNSYKQYWTRINRLIEEGTYSRDRFKMELHSKGPKEAQAPKRSLSPPSEMEQIYRQYLEARKACNLPVTNITQDMIASVIEKQKPVITQKYRCEQVEFKVVIEDGKPKIKARPKSELP